MPRPNASASGGSAPRATSSFTRDQFLRELGGNETVCVRVSFEPSEWGATMLGSVSTGGANIIGAGTGLSPNIFLTLSNDFGITSAVLEPALRRSTICPGRADDLNVSARHCSPCASNHVAECRGAAGPSVFREIRARISRRVRGSAPPSGAPRFRFAGALAPPRRRQSAAEQFAHSGRPAGHS